MGEMYGFESPGDATQIILSNHSGKTVRVTVEFAMGLRKLLDKTTASNIETDGYKEVFEGDITFNPVRGGLAKLRRGEKRTETAPKREFVLFPPDSNNSVRILFQQEKASGSEGRQKASKFIFKLQRVRVFLAKKFQM